MPQIAWHLITHPSAYLNRSLVDSVLYASRPLGFINFLAPELYLLAIPKIILGIVTSTLTTDGRTVWLPWHMTQNVTFAFLSFIYGLARLKAIICWILVRVCRLGNESSEVIQRKAHEWSDVMLICIVMAVTIPPALTFARKTPHRKIMTMNISKSARQESRIVARFRNSIPRDKLIAVDHSILREFHDYKFIPFSTKPRSVERIVKREPYFLIVGLSNRRFAEEKVLARLKNEKNISYEVIFDVAVIVYSRVNGG